MPLGEGRYEIPSPTLVRAGETLLGLGIPLEKSLDVIEDVARQADSVAAAFVKLFLDRIWKPFDRAGQPEPDWPAVLAALEQLRPLATEVLVAIFQPRMTQATEKAFGRELDRRAKRASRTPARRLTATRSDRAAPSEARLAARSNAQRAHPSPRSFPPCRSRTSPRAPVAGARNIERRPSFGWLVFVIARPLHRRQPSGPRRSRPTRKA